MIFAVSDIESDGQKVAMGVMASESFEVRVSALGEGEDNG